MPYKHVNFDPDSPQLPAFDDTIEDTLNAEERDGWRVINVHRYKNGHVKVLLHREPVPPPGQGW
ncbi:hypothetical protein [Nocardioides sp.]|uniref:hypothetical protein n=1 Tax=Nocardioides sp. TaxID=35761 RepID=UPI00260A244B|nr:hypothetical protein [Nocardioides sp.]MCW2738852.1 hypothetical protein [Nocardioides sp.]